MESLEENEILNYGELSNDNENTIVINGSGEGKKVDDEDEVSPRMKSKVDQISEPAVDSPSSGPPSKGKGLRKWRRIKREIVKDGSGSVDSNKATKRGLSGSVPNPIKPQVLSPDSRQKSDGSFSSTSAVVRNFGSDMYNSLDPRLSIGLNFGADSENSEDRSSISSTAASGSVLRSNGVLNEKNMVNKNNGGFQKGQQEKARGVKNNSKKPKGGEVEIIEKENSLSSLESDSRSSNFVFVQGSNSVTSNGKQSVKGLGGDEVEAVDSKENGGGFDGLGHEDSIDVDNHCSLADQDPLVESNLNLQSAQEALEKEIQKMREMGDECERIINQEVHEASTSELLNPRETSPRYFQKHVNNLKEPNVVAKSKGAEATEIEYEEIENLFKQKLEAELEYLVTSTAIQKMEVHVADQVAVSNEVKNRLNEVKDAESKAEMLKEKAKILESCIEDTVETGQISELQKRVRKVTSCLFIQLILLVIVFLSFLFHLSPHHPGVVPT